MHETAAHTDPSAEKAQERHAQRRTRYELVVDDARLDQEPHSLDQEAALCDIVAFARAAQVDDEACVLRSWNSFYVTVLGQARLCTLFLLGLALHRRSS